MGGPTVDVIDTSEKRCLLSQRLVSHEHSGHAVMKRRRSSSQIRLRSLRAGVSGVVLAGWMLASASPAAGRPPQPNADVPPDGSRALRPVRVGSDKPAPEVVPGRLLVRYRDSVDACAHCVLAAERPFATVTGSDSLDRLHAELGVKSARPLLFARHGLSAAQARTAFDRWIARIRARFPSRSARARPGEKIPDLTQIYELELDPSVDVFAAARRYAADPAVAYAEPVAIAHATTLPDDPFLSSSGSWGQSYADLWGHLAIGAPAAWDLSRGSGVVVGVVDTGVDATHPDLAGNVWTNPGEVPDNGLDDDGNGFVDDATGWDFAADDADPDDRNGHGTHVAGTIAAVADNGIGIAGVASGARILRAKGLGDDGRGRLSDLIEAMMYAAENGADVINNSWGGFSVPSQTLFDALSALHALGVVVVSAAGNDGREVASNLYLYLPAGHPDGLTVGALTPFGDLAGFSNHGPILSLAAPGVDVLSLRAKHETLPARVNVGDHYARLSGTSMASPHVAGAAALLLSAAPELSVDEVRWHLELGAHQPGAPGFEGERRNPLFGYGILDAAAAFDDPPVTTRLAPPFVTEWHVLPTTPTLPGRPGSFRFTTLDPVAWSVAAPAGLSPRAPAGAGDSPLVLDVTAGGLAPGTYEGQVALIAPSAVDGGDGFPVRLHVHEDVRAGSRIRVGGRGAGAVLGFSPEARSNPFATLVAWRGREIDAELLLARIDNAGTVTGPTLLVDRLRDGNAFTAGIATDGSDFLVLWEFENPWSTPPSEGIKLVRVAADGTVLDPRPIALFSRRAPRRCRFTTLAGAGFDGKDYWVASVDTSICGAQPATVFVHRVHPDGSFGEGRRLVRLGPVAPIFRCRPGGCLLLWYDWQVEGTDPNGKFLRSAYALPVVDGQPAAAPAKVATDLWAFSDMAFDGSAFLALSKRNHVCVRGEGVCRSEIVGLRLDPSGRPLDPDVIVVDSFPAADRLRPWPGGVTFDGTDWVVTYQLVAVDDTPFHDGSYVFANRIRADGTPMATEYGGWLVDDAGRAGYSRAVSAATQTLVVYEDGRNDPTEGIAGFPIMSEHSAQGIFPHPVGPEFQARAIGSIGATTVPEGETIRWRLVAPGLGGSSIELAATGLPSGALFDPNTALFQWRPRGDEGGSAASVTFRATSGSQTVAETVDLLVTEAVPTLRGTVHLADGTPLAGVALQVRGTSDRSRTLTTDALGRYRVEGLTPGRRVSVGLARSARKAYRSAPRSLRLVAPSGDALAPDLVLMPR